MNLIEWIKNPCIFCWLTPLEKAWVIYNAFIDYNFSIGGLHRIGAIWVAAHFWTDMVLIFFAGFWLKDKWKGRKR